MFEQSDHIVRGLSLVTDAHKGNWLSVGKFYRSNCARSQEIVKFVQYTDSARRAAAFFAVHPSR